MIAQSLQKSILLNTYYILNGKSYAEVDIEAGNDYQSYKDLPAVIQVRGIALVKTAYNSDRHLAYYQSGKVFGSY